MSRASRDQFGTDAEERQQAVRNEGSERVGDRLPQRGRQVVALARVVHDVNRPHVAALVHEPVVPVVDEIPSQDRGRDDCGPGSEIAHDAPAPQPVRGRARAQRGGDRDAAGDHRDDTSGTRDLAPRMIRSRRRNRSLRRERATMSAIVVAATAPTAVATNALPYLPLPGVIGPSTFAAAAGASRLAKPIARLVIVSRRS